MAATARILLSVLMLPALLSSGFAQQSAPSPPPTSSAVVNVLNAHGNAIRNLSKENFRLRVNGKPVALVDARYTVAPRRIVVVLDLSGSMVEEKPTWQIAHDAVEDLLVQTPTDVSIAMLTFANTVRDRFDFRQSRPAIAKWLSEGPGQRPKLKQPAKTALFDAILEALKLLDPIQPGDAIYAITDGGENASKASTGRTKIALRQSGVRLFAFLLDEALPADVTRRKSFLEMVDDSGGFVLGLAGRQKPDSASWDVEYVYDKDSRKRITAYTEELNVQVNGFWMLEFVNPSSNKDSKINLEVVGDTGKSMKDVWITYPRRISTAAR